MKLLRPSRNGIYSVHLCAYPVASTFGKYRNPDEIRPAIIANHKTNRDVAEDLVEFNTLSDMGYTSLCNFTFSLS